MIESTCPRCGHRQPLTGLDRAPVPATSGPLTPEQAAQLVGLVQAWTDQEAASIDLTQWE